jgi:hypothetical protein
MAESFVGADLGRPEAEFLTLFRRGQASIALETAVGFDASR